LEATVLTEQNWKAIIEAAVKVEDQSIALYTMALENAKYPSSKVFFKELVEEEKHHKKKLEAILKDRRKISQLGSGGSGVQDLKIVDMLEDTPLSDEADYEAILVYAAKRALMITIKHWLWGSEEQIWGNCSPNWRRKSWDTRISLKENMMNAS
jgi:hypothetical protein